MAPYPGLAFGPEAGVQPGAGGHRDWRRPKLLVHLAPGLVSYGLMEVQRKGLGLSFYGCRQKLITGRLRLDLSPLSSLQMDPLSRDASSEEESRDEGLVESDVGMPCNWSYWTANR